MNRMAWEFGFPRVKTISPEMTYRTYVFLVTWLVSVFPTVVERDDVQLLYPRHRWPQCTARRSILSLC